MSTISSSSKEPKLIYATEDRGLTLKTVYIDELKDHVTDATRRIEGDMFDSELISEAVKSKKVFTKDEDRYKELMEATKDAYDAEIKPRLKSPRFFVDEYKQKKLLDRLKGYRHHEPVILEPKDKPKKSDFEIALEEMFKNIDSKKQ